MSLDTFLNYDSFKDFRDQVQKIIQKSLQLGRGKRLQYLKTQLPFDRCFETKGMYGIAGLLKYIVTPASSKKVYQTKTKFKTVKTPEVSIPIVFKLSVDIDWTIDHESFVLRHLNELRKYCPHFVGELGILSLPISKDFIETERGDDDDDEYEDEDDEDEKQEEPKLSLYEDGPGSLPTMVMLLEYVGKYNLEQVCERGYNVEALSQMIMVLSALQMAQQTKSFVHYDLHLQNVLLREIDPKSFFFYRFSDRQQILTPTNGLYPVLIDMGSSYIRDYDGQPLQTSIGNYKSGLMSTEFDPLNDIHHFLFRCIDYLEENDERWRDIGTKLMYMFRKLPIWRYKGWKHLSADIHKMLLKTTMEWAPKVCTSSFFMKYANAVIDIVVSGTTVKWTQQYVTLEETRSVLTPTIQHLVLFLTQLDVYVEDEDKILFLLKEWIQFCTQKSFTDFTEWKQRLSELIGKLPAIDWKQLYESTRLVVRCYTDLLYRYNQANHEQIASFYKEIPIQQPYDMIHFLQRSYANRTTLYPDSSIYIWDAVHKSHTVIQASELGVQQPIEVLFRDQEKWKQIIDQKMGWTRVDDQLSKMTI